jgi:hypothetical protein
MNYGAGKPGTHGIPQFIATQPPIVGGTTVVEIQSGLPGASPILVIGGSQAALALDGGTLLVTPSLVLPLPVPLSPAGSLAIPGALPADPGLCGLQVFVQALFVDPGAAGAQHLAMTPGLGLLFGS